MLKMSYLVFMGNCEELKNKLLACSEKVSVHKKKIFRSEELVSRNDPLWGYYNIKLFICTDENKIPYVTKELIPKMDIYAGDFYHGFGYIVKKLKN
jgi:hypothetical protein